MALSLPDICGKVAYPGESNSQRYRKWFENNVEFPLRGMYNGDPVDFNAFACWQLRCAYSHSGDFDLTKDAPKIRIKKFRFFYTSEGEKIKSATYPENDGYTMDFDVCYFCKVLCKSAREFYMASDKKEMFALPEIVDRVEYPEVGTIKIKIHLSQIPKDGILAEGELNILPPEDFEWGQL